MKVLSNDFTGSGPISSSTSIKSSEPIQDDSDWSDEEERSGDLLKFKAQIGVINKLRVTILVASNIKEREILDINVFRRVKKIENKMQCNLIFSTFDDTEDI